MPPISYVTKQLLIINVVVFAIMELLMPQLRELFALFYPFSSEGFSPWQLVTHMFTHANFNHILFNMFALYMFGSALEHYLGAKRFLQFYLISGLGAMLFYVATLYGSASGPSAMMGASGAVFGLLAGYGMAFPNSTIMLLIPPIPIKAKYFVIIYALIELYGGVYNTSDGIAHFAHLGGAIVGAVLMKLWSGR